MESLLLEAAEPVAEQTLVAPPGKTKIGQVARDRALHAQVADAAPPWLLRGQVPGLHGFRAFSILLVLVAHFAQQGTVLPCTWHLTQLGHLGVDMFFVISGFLITLLLLREQARDGAVSLKGFYMRRAYRILPAYLFFLAGIGLMQCLNAAALAGADWLAALTYTVGFLPRPAWDIGHIWSLSVEEHFYLLWPLAVYCWPRRAWIAAALTIGLTPLLRLVIDRHLPGLHVDYCSLTRMDTIAVGCGLAYLAHGPWFQRLLRMPAGCAYPATIALLLAVLLSERLAQQASLYRLLAHPMLVAVAFALAIWLWIGQRSTILGAVLNCRPAVWLGTLSYSLYLWQQPFLNPRSDAWFTQAPFNLLGIAALACFSYLLIERPFLRLKDRAGTRCRPRAAPASACADR